MIPKLTNPVCCSTAIAPGVSSFKYQWRNVFRLFNRLLCFLILGVCAPLLPIHAQDCIPEVQCRNITIALENDGNAVITPSQADDSSPNNCGVATATLSQAEFDCNDVGSPVADTLFFTVEATGATNYCIFTVTIQDNIGPSFSYCPPDVTLTCGESAPTDMPIASDNCTTATISTLPDVVSSGTDCYTIQRNWRVTDASGNTATCSQVITYEDTTPPTLDFGLAGPPADVTVTSCNNLNFPMPTEVVAPPILEDDCDAGLVLETSAVSTRGTDPSMCDYYNYTVTRIWKTEDNCGNADSVTQVYTYNILPGFGDAPDTEQYSVNGSCNASVVLDYMPYVTAYYCGDVPDLTVSVEIFQDGNTTNIYNEQTLNIMTDLMVGNYTFEFTIIDPCGETARHIVDAEVVDNLGPVAVCDAISEISIPGDTYNFNAEIFDNGSHDPCDPDAVLDFAISVNGSTPAQDTFFTCADIGTTPTLVLYVTDSQGITTTCDIDPITISDQSGPQVLCQDITVHLGGDGIYDLDAIELENGVMDCSPLDRYEVSIDTGIVATTFATNEALDCDFVGTHTATIRVYDVLGYFSDCETTITVLDTIAPVIFCPAEYTVYLDSAGLYTFDAADYTMLTGTPTEACEYTTSVSNAMFDCGDVVSNPDSLITVTVTDASGNTASCIVDISVMDTLTQTPDCQDITVALNGFGVTTILATDLLNSQMDEACPPLYELSLDSAFWNTSMTVNCDSLSADTSFWVRYTDNAGNISEACSAMVTFDTPAPIAQCDELVTNLSITGEIVIHAEQFDQGSDAACGEELFYFFTTDLSQPFVEQDTFDCSHIGSQVIYFQVKSAIIDTDTTFTDSSYCETLLTIQDNTPPSVTCPADVTLNCSAQLGSMIHPDSTGYATAADNCDGVITPTYQDNVISFTSPWCQTIRRVWRATDNNGRTGFCFQFITIQDTIAPTFTPPVDVTISTCEDPNDLTLTGDVTDEADNCDILVTDGATREAFYYDNNPGFVGTYVSGNWNYTNSAGTGGFTYIADTLVLTSPDDGGCTYNAPETMDEIIYEITVPTTGIFSFSWEYTTADSSAARDPFGIYYDDNYFPITATNSSIPQGTIIQAGTTIGFSLRSVDGTCGASQVKIFNFLAPSCAPQTIERAWTLEDACGNDSIAMQNIVMMPPADGPEFDFPAAVNFGTAGGSFSCAAMANLDLTNAVTGACGDAFSSVSYDIYRQTSGGLVHYSDGNSLDASGVYPVGVYNVIFEAIDLCGIRSTHSLTMTITDNEVPQALCVSNLNLTLNASGIGTLTPQQIDSGSSDACGVVALDIVPSSFDCSDVGPNVVTLYVTDSNGNTNSCTTIVTVFNNTPPAILCPADITIDCVDALFPDTTLTGAATIINNCPTTPELDFLDSFAPSSTGCYDILRNWSVVDAAGTLLTSCMQTITVADDEMPEFMDVPQDTIVDCHNIFTSTAPTATDNCFDIMDSDIVFQETSDQGTNPGDCSYYRYTITRTWTIEVDTCNAPVVAEQMLTVQDTTPVAFYFPDTLVVPNTPGLCQTLLNLDLSDETTNSYIMDNCAAFGDLSITNTISDESGNPVLNGNGTNGIDGLYDVGFYNISFTALDPCLNYSEFAFVLEIRDTETPEAECFTSVNLTLNSAGNGILEVEDLEDGSQDNCGGELSYELSQYNFDCSMIGSNFVTVTVTDAAGNTNTCVTEVIVSATDPSLALNLTTNSVQASSYASSDGSVSVTVTGGVGPFTYLWDDPSGSTSDTVAGLPVGVYTVIVTDTGTDCQASTTATVVGPCPTFSPGSIITDPSTVVNIPVTVSNFTEMVSAQFSLTIPDANFDILTVTDFAMTDLVLNNFIIDQNANTISLSWFDSTGDGATLPDGAVLFNIQLFVTGNAMPGDCSDILIGSDPVIFETGQMVNGLLESVPPCTVAGSVCVQVTGSLMITGSVQRPNSVGVENTQIKLTGDVNETITTDATGNFSFTDIPPGSTVKITPCKDTNPGNGVSTIDLVIIQEHILGTTPFTSPYDWIAADANSSGTVSTLDLVELQYIILGTFSDFSNNTSWRFVDADYVFPNPNDPWEPAFPECKTLGPLTANSSVDFIGIKIGDLNGNANPALAPGQNNNVYWPEARAESTLYFNVADKAAQKDEIVEIDFTAHEFEAIRGYQFTLNFDKNSLEFVDFESEMAEKAIFGTNRIEDGILTSSWFNAKTRTLENDETVFTLQFKAKQDVKNIRELLYINSDITAAEAYSTSYRNMDVSLKFIDGTTANDFVLYQNRPNPVKNQTVISFNLPEASQATLSIMDISGRIVKQLQRNFHAGYNEIMLNRSELNASGVLYYRLDAQNNSATHKMILIN